MILAFGAVAYKYVKMPAKLDIASMIVPNDSYVFDNKGEKIGTISRKQTNQKNISYNKLNQGLINIAVGTEDNSFFQHKGVDIISTIKSFVNTTVLKKSTSGGSTITQQLLGNTHLDRSERSINRKLYEIFLSVQAESEVDKSQIMELYFNYVFFGYNNIYGIEQASNFFFSQDAASLDTIQNALMVGTVNAPTFFNPLGGTNTEGAYVNNSQARLQQVLQASRNQGYITESELSLLKQVQVQNVVKITELDSSSDYSAFLDIVRKEVTEKYELDLNKESYSIYTTMDREKQDYANAIIRSEIPGVELPEVDMDSGFVLTKTQTGEISAVGGGKEYNNGGQLLFNNAVDMKQQPGSAFKPIIDYSPTFEFLHWGNRAPIQNGAYKYPGTNIQIRNSNGNYSGTVTIDSALAQSLNVTAIKAMEEVVKKEGFEGLNGYLKKLGFSFKDSELVYSYGLGAGAVSPAEMNGAMQAFGNGGLYIKPFTITKLVSEKGKEIANPTKPVQAIDARTAFMTATTLEKSTQSSSLVTPAGYYATPYAGKSGTTDWGDEGLQYGIPSMAARDSWFTGFTNEYTMTVWSGFTTEGIKKGKSPQFYNNEHDYAAIIWGAMMRHSVTGNETSYLTSTPPEGIVSSAFSPTDPAPFKLPSQFSKSEVGYFYADNMPSGESKPDFDPDKFKIAAPTYLDGILTFNFLEINVEGVSYHVFINNVEYQAGPGSQKYSIKPGESWRAFYKYRDVIFNEISGSISPAVVTPIKPEDPVDTENPEEPGTSE